MPIQVVPFIIGAALTAGGAGLQVAGAQVSKRRMEDAVAAELARANELQRKAKPIVNESIERSSPDEAQKQISRGKERQRSKASQLQTQRINQGGVLDRGRPQNVDAGTEHQRQTGNITRGNLMGVTQFELDQMIKNIRANQRLGTIADFARGSANVLPFEVQDASHAGDSLRGAGGIMSAVGGPIMTGGLLGVFPTAAGGGGPTAFQTASAAGLTETGGAARVLPRILAQPVLP